MSPSNYNDFIGSRIVRVATMSADTCDDVTVYRAFVQVEDGRCVELLYGDPEAPPTIQAADIDERYLETLNESHDDLGRIAAFVTSDYWPAIGVLTDNGHIIYCTDDPVSRSVGPCVQPLGRKYFMEDLKPIPLRQGGTGVSPV